MGSDRRDEDAQRRSRLAGRLRRTTRAKRDRAREMRRAPTLAERTLWHALRRGQLGRRFRRQHPLGPFIVDFFCASADLVVEVDGDVHLEQEAYDEGRDAWMLEQGFDVLRVTNDDVLYRLDEVLRAIRDRFCAR